MLDIWYWILDMEALPTPRPKRGWIADTGYWIWISVGFGWTPYPVFIYAIRLLYSNRSLYLTKSCQRPPTPYFYLILQQVFLRYFGWSGQIYLYCLLCSGFVSIYGPLLPRPFITNSTRKQPLLESLNWLCRLCKRIYPFAICKRYKAIFCR